MFLHVETLISMDGTLRTVPMCIEIDLNIFARRIAKNPTNTFIAHICSMFIVVHIFHSCSTRVSLCTSKGKERVRSMHFETIKPIHRECC